MRAVELSRIEHVVVAHNPVAEGDDPSSSDVLAQVELVGSGLAELGIDWSAVAFPGEWGDGQPRGMAALLASSGPSGVLGKSVGKSVVRKSVGRRAGANVDERVGKRIRKSIGNGAGESAAAGESAGLAILNLVEAPPGSPALHPAAAAAFELLRLPFTGSAAPVLWLTTDKLATRALLAADDLPLAPGGRLDLANPRLLERVAGPWIVKPGCEDASLGLEGDPLCTTREQVLARGHELARRFPRQPLVLESYLPGRELNVSLLAPLDPSADGLDLEALPVAEILFDGYPEDMARVVTWEAKWRPDSFAYAHTVRHFPEETPGSADAALLAQARRIALAAARACGVSGYSRVDLRLDADGVPRVLEVNANPCLSADAGFMAAAARAGLSPGAVVARLLTAALREHDLRQEQFVPFMPDLAFSGFATPPGLSPTAQEGRGRLHPIPLSRPSRAHPV